MYMSFSNIFTIESFLANHKPTYSSHLKSSLLYLLCYVNVFTLLLNISYSKAVHCILICVYFFEGFKHAVTMSKLAPLFLLRSITLYNHHRLPCFLIISLLNCYCSIFKFDFIWFSIPMPQSHKFAFSRKPIWSTTHSTYGNGLGQPIISKYIICNGSCNWNRITNNVLGISPLLDSINARGPGY